MNALPLIEFTDFTTSVNGGINVMLENLQATVHVLYYSRYNIKLWKTFTDCFNCLPVAAIVDEKIFCCHGGNCWIFHCLTRY